MKAAGGYHKEIDSVLQKLVDDPATNIDVQHNEAEEHHTPRNERRETAEDSVTQMAGTPAGAMHDCEAGGSGGGSKEVSRCGFPFPT